MTDSIEGGPDGFRVMHFALSNPKGKFQDSVPLLLRRTADVIEDLGHIWVQDLVLHQELDDEGKDWPAVAVYFSEKVRAT